jgi:acyl-CoA thioester hydrolase
MTEQRERFRVAWIDTDAAGRIHFTAAFRWAEATETALFRRLGLLDDELGGYPRRSVAADYRRPLFFEDEIEVRLRVEKLGTTSITFAWEILRDDEVAIAGSHTIVSIDAEGRKRAFDNETRELLT